MNTAIQDLIDYSTNKYGSNSDVANDIICKAMSSLKREKQQMKDAVMHNVTRNTLLKSIFEKQFEEYYNETFKK